MMQNKPTLPDVEKSKPKRGFSKPPIPLKQKKDGTTRMRTRKFLKWARKNFKGKRDQLAHPGKTGIRKLGFRKPILSSKYEMREPKYRLPALIHIGAPDAPNGGCTACADNLGPFKDCRLPTDEAVLEMTKGACTGCYWGNRWERCTFHRASKFYNMPTSARKRRCSSSQDEHETPATSTTQDKSGISPVPAHSKSTDSGEKSSEDEESVKNAETAEVTDDDNISNNSSLFLTDSDTSIKAVPRNLLPSVAPLPPWMTYFNASVDIDDAKALRTHNKVLKQVFKANVNRAIQLDLKRAFQKGRRNSEDITSAIEHEPTAGTMQKPATASLRWADPLVTPPVAEGMDGTGSKRQKTEQVTPKKYIHRAGFVMTDSEESSADGALSE